MTSPCVSSPGRGKPPEQVAPSRLARRDVLEHRLRLVDAPRVSQQDRRPEGGFVVARKTRACLLVRLEVAGDLIARRRCAGTACTRSARSSPRGSVSPRRAGRRAVLPRLAEPCRDDEHRRGLPPRMSPPAASAASSAASNRSASILGPCMPGASRPHHATHHVRLHGDAIPGGVAGGFDALRGRCARRRARARRRTRPDGAPARRRRSSAHPAQ